VPQTSTLRKKCSEPQGQKAKKYDFYGHSTLTLYEPTDSEALARFAEHFGVSKITLESFRGIGGKRIMCGKRQVFPPTNANA